MAKTRTTVIEDFGFDFEIEYYFEKGQKGSWDVEEIPDSYRINKVSFDGEEVINSKIKTKLEDYINEHTEVVE